MPGGLQAGVEDLQNRNCNELLRVQQNCLETADCAGLSLAWPKGLPGTGINELMNDV